MTGLGSYRGVSFQLAILRGVSFQLANQASKASWKLTPPNRRGQFQRCPMAAVTMGDTVSSVDLGRCIGCGLCITTCPTEAMLLQPKEDHYIPPATTAEQMMTMAGKRALVA